MRLITGIPFSGLIRDNIKVFLISFLRLMVFIKNLKFDLHFYYCFMYEKILKMQIKHIIQSCRY